MNKKFCWVATQTKKGWRLKLAFGNKDYPVRGLLLPVDRKEIEKVVNGAIVFVHLKDDRI